MKIARPALGAAILCVCIAVLVACADYFGPVADRIQEWQTLVGAMVALMAAVYGGHFLSEQTNAAREHRADDIARRNRALKAAMPLYLSAIADWATRTAHFYVKAARCWDEEQLRFDTRRMDGETFPDLDMTLIDNIKAMMEVADDAQTNDYAMILGLLQVHAARGRDFNAHLYGDQRGGGLGTVRSEILYAARIYARAANLVGLSRPPEMIGPDDIRPTTLSGALRSMGVPGHGDLFAEIWEMAGNAEL